MTEFLLQWCLYSDHWYHFHAVAHSQLTLTNASVVPALLLKFETSLCNTCYSSNMFFHSVKDLHITNNCFLVESFHLLDDASLFWSNGFPSPQLGFNGKKALLLCCQFWKYKDEDPPTKRQSALPIHLFLFIGSLLCTNNQTIYYHNILLDDALMWI